MNRKSKLPDHSILQRRWANGAFRQRALVRDYGVFISKIADWDAFGTLTFAFAPSPQGATRAVEHLMRGFEKLIGHSMAWVAVQGRGDVGHKLHLHLLVAGVSDVEIERLRREGSRRVGDCDFVKYDKDRGAAYYLAQHALSPDGDLIFGGRLLENANDEAIEHPTPDTPEPDRVDSRGRPRVNPPDGRAIDYLRRTGISWRTMARDLELSSGTLRRAYDAWLDARGFKRAKTKSGSRTTVTKQLTAPTRAKKLPRRSL